MSKKQKQYTRLRGAALISSNRLYLMPDHLLSISTTFFSEDHMRFYYKDIQAIITRKTLMGKILNLSFGILLIIFFIPALRLNGGWAVFFFTVTGLFFLLLIINWLRGPTCICHILTPIQTVRLHALKRIRNAKKAMDQLLPLIESTQGILSRESISEIQQEEESKPAIKKALTAFRHEQGTFHIFLFSLLLINGVFITIDIFYQNIALSLISSLIMMATAVFLIISLIKQTGSNLYKALKVITWSTVLYMCVALISSYIVSFYAMIKNPGISNNQLEFFNKISSLSPMENPWLMGLSVFDLSCSFIIGISGLLFLRKFRKEYEKSQDGPKPSHDDAFL